MTQSPTDPDEPTVDAARVTLAFCRDNPTDPDALPQLNALRELLKRPELADDVVAAARAVVHATMTEQAPGPVQQAHIIILFASLLELEARREEVDALFVDWLRHPASYGAARATPPAFQRAEFVQRFADLMGWGTLDLGRDREAIARFLEWVNSWALRNKHRVRRTLDALRRNFPAPDLWKLVRFN